MAHKLLNFREYQRVVYHRSVRPMNARERSKIQGWIDAKPPERPRGFWFGWDFSGASFEQFAYESSRKLIPQWEEILADGHVVVHALQPKSVVELLQIEDECESYFFDIGDGQVFCLRHVSESPENDSEWERWPNSDFEAIHSRTHPDFFREIWCHGTKLVPTRKIDQHEDYLWHLLPEEPVYDGTLATIRQDLERLAEANRS